MDDEPSGKLSGKISTKISDKIRPTAGGQRFGAIDTLRGFALLGILAPNIVAFSWPMNAMTDPNVMGDTPENHLGHTITSTAFLGKFMFLFAMLFGSGVVMYARKYDEQPGIALCARCGYPLVGLAEDASCPECNCAQRRLKKPKLTDGAGLWYLRCGILLVFGLLHAYGLWFGDILTFYAVTGLTLLWWVRRLNPKLLFFGGLAVYYLGSLLMVGVSYFGYTALVRGNIDASDLGADPMSEIAGYTGTYWDAFRTRFFAVLMMQLFIGVFFQPLLLGIMCMGIGLTRMKIMTGERSLRFYVIWGISLFSLGIPMTAIGNILVYKEFSLLPGFMWQAFAQPLGVPLALGYGALVIALAKSGAVKFITDPLAAVGRMALSNYFLHTIVCTTFFYGYGFGYFAQIEYPYLWLVVGCVWMMNIVFSLLWLRSFTMGPFEWIWRVMTYRQVVPIRRRG